MFKPHGIIPALVTPFNSKGEIQEEVLRQLITRAKKAGCHGVFVLGSNGEFFSLNNEEKIRIAEIAVNEAAGEIPVYVGTGTNSTKETIQLNHKMEDIGVSAVSIITPYFVKHTQDELFHHYESVVNETNLPIILYNIPGLTGNPLAPSTVSKLARFNNIVAIKDSSGNFDNVLQYIEAQDDNFTVLIGTDSLILSTLMAGGGGAIAATANLLPEVVVAIYEKWQSGDLIGAEAEQKKLKLIRNAFKKGTLPSVLKESINQTGIHVGDPRLPVSLLSEEIKQEIEQIVQSYRDSGDIR